MHYQPILSFITAIFAMILTSCGDENNPAPSEQEAFLTINENLLNDGINYTYAADTKSFLVKSNRELTVTSSQPEWCIATIEPINNSEQATLTVEVKKNESTVERKATVTVTAADITRQISVTQGGKSRRAARRANQAGYPGSTGERGCKVCSEHGHGMEPRQPDGRLQQ